MKSLLLIFALVLTNLNSIAATCVSVGNGDWDDPLTWSCGTVPAPGDTIIINVGDTVTLNSTEILNGAPMYIVVNGYFLFDTPGAKLHLECGSEVIVSPTGEIASSGVGQPSHNIKICGQEVWQGFEGPVLGPAILVGPLPIELVSFDAEQVGVMVTASWETASEYNNDYFALQGSIDGNIWMDLTYIDGAGTTDQTQYYSAEFDNRYKQYSYFRLRQTDYNGTSSFSKAVSVKLVETAELIAFPNPMTDGLLTVQWNPDLDHVSISVVDINGRIIDSKSEIQSDSQLYNTSSWQSGYYIIQLNSNAGVETLKLVKP